MLQKQPRPTGVSLIVDNKKVSGAFVCAESNETISVTIYNNFVFIFRMRQSLGRLHTLCL